MLKSKVVCSTCGFKGTVPSDKFKHGTTLKCSSCGSDIVFHKNIHFKEQAHFNYVDANDFMHTQDLQAMQTLLKVPGLSLVLKTMIKNSYEVFQRISHWGENIKVTTKTCGYIHDMVSSASAILGVPCPDVFIAQRPYAECYTTCVDKPLITINSGMVELLNDEELYAIIAHEVGHVKCGHVVYNMLHRFIVKFPDLFGITGMLLSGINIAILEWRRKSEFSCDRAAAIVLNNKEVVISSLLKLAGGSPSLMNMMDFGDFQKQYDEYNELINGTGQKLVNTAAVIMREQPFPMVRAVELSKWKGFIKEEKVSHSAMFLA